MTSDSHTAETTTAKGTNYKRWFVITVVVSIIIGIGLRFRNSAAGYHPVFEKIDFSTNASSNFEFTCEATGDYELAFEFIFSPELKDFEDLVWERDSPFDLEWSINDSSGTAIAAGTFQKFSSRDTSRKRNVLAKSFLAIRKMADLKRRITRGVGKFPASAGESYQIRIQVGNSESILPQTDPRILVLRERQVATQALSQSVAITVVCSLMVLITLFMWAFHVFWGSSNKLDA